MNITLKILISVLGLLGHVYADTCRLSTESLQQMSERYVELIDDAGESVLLRVKVADESNEQAAGFQFICPQTIDSTAILFVFEEPKLPVFHMNNVHANLDIAFIDVDGRVGDVQLMLEEFTTGESKLYPSEINTKYALEVRQGYFSEHNISARNSRIKFDE